MVELVEDPRSLMLTVQDDGLGMQADRLNGSEGDDRLGIRGMRERAGLIGGELDITSAAGQGTRVTLTVPVERGADDSCPDL